MKYLYSTQNRYLLMALYIKNLFTKLRRGGGKIKNGGDKHS